MKVLASLLAFLICNTVTSQTVNKNGCSDSLIISDIIPKDTNFFEIPDTGFYKNALIEWNTYPEFPGGQKGLINYINENSVYPSSARKDSIEGRVILFFLIDIDGCTRNIRVRQGIRNDLDNECIRVIKEMPKWKPATIIKKSEKGWYRTNSPMYYTVPFNFSLSTKNRENQILIFPEKQ